MEGRAKPSASPKKARAAKRLVVEWFAVHGVVRVAKDHNTTPHAITLFPPYLSTKAPPITEEKIDQIYSVKLGKIRWTRLLLMGLVVLRLFCFAPSLRPPALDLRMGLWTLLQGFLLFANALAILNEDRFLGPRGWSLAEVPGGRKRSVKDQVVGLIYAAQYMRLPLMVLNIITIVVKLVSG
ncbi:hypothetical protein Nepgr_024888 [Nepenthes gracilis]|uniref:Yos1-like protein n=1 Tax=Nepenthes gracilis TaxID=150966 RepID=A0AAD3T417_NEPGR|nr:hypothetical protein Nepgr_024888 [Nepenthes gracilis]